MEAFDSRRNRVVRTPHGVVKTYACAQAMATECGQLRLLHARGVAVPEIRAQRGRALLLSDLRAPTLYDALWQMERGGAPVERAAPLFAALAHWLSAYYAAVQHPRTGQIRADMHARNFLWDGARVWGVDFEQTACGAREEDLGALCAYLYTYDPAQTDYKRALVQLCLSTVAQALGLQPDRTRAYMRREWAAMAQRRRGFCMPQSPWEGAK